MYMRQSDLLNECFKPMFEIGSRETRLEMEIDEHKEYEEVNKNLGSIIAKGIDTRKYKIETDIAGLPEYSPKGLEKFLKISFRPEYRQQNESVESYLTRVFETFDHDFDEENSETLEKKNKLCLVFDSYRSETRKFTDKFRLFKPLYASLPEIVKEVEVRETIIHFRFKRFIEDFKSDKKFIKVGRSILPLMHIIKEKDGLYWLI